MLDPWSGTHHFYSRGHNQNHHVRTFPHGLEGALFSIFSPDCFLIGGHVPNFLRELGTFLGSPRGYGRGFFLEPRGVRTSPGQLPARGLLSILLLPRKVSAIGSQKKNKPEGLRSRTGLGVT